MRTFYAIALICLSVPAFANELEFDMPHDSTTETGYLYNAGADFNFGDEITATIFMSATPKSEDQSVAAVEVGSLYDAGADFNFNDENTATINTPATPKSEDHPLELGLFTAEDWNYQGDALGDVDAFPADDWF